MKVIFFDVDGVLNFASFYEKYQFSDEDTPPVDSECVRCLAEIAHRSGAVLVCSSSWRAGWSKDSSQIDPMTQLLVDEFTAAGISIYDKTKMYNGYERPREVLEWMISCPEKIDAYLCIDDVDFGWKKYGLRDHWLKTDFEDGGLKECHIEKAVRILEEKPGLSEFQKIKYRVRLSGTRFEEA